MTADEIQKYVRYQTREARGIQLELFPERTTKQRNLGSSTSCGGMSLRSQPPFGRSHFVGTFDAMVNHLKYKKRK